MARFEVRETFRCTSRGQVVLAGVILDGSVHIGDTAILDLQQGLGCSAEIIGVEYLDRIAVGETLVCLVLAERDAKEASVYSELCPPGTVIGIEEPARLKLSTRCARTNSHVNFA